MNNNVLILTRGIPASGKSTWAAKWANEDFKNRVRINRDDIRYELSEMLYGKPSWVVLDADGKMDADFEQKVSALESSRVAQALGDGKSVVIDNTHLPINSIEAWRSTAEKYGAILATKEFPVEIQEAKRRNTNRINSGDRGVEDVVWGIMESRLNPDGSFPYVAGVVQANSSTYKAGGCVVCGRKLRNGGNIGPTCAKKYA